MSFYAIDSYDRRNDHSWYKTAAASAVTASALNKPFAVELTSTTSMAPSAGDGKVLGMSAIAVGPNASQTMIARYSENSTEQNPIIMVSLGDYGSYNISVKDVDPKEATQIEMFALCAYMDDKNITCPGSFGSYNRLKSYIQTAIDMDELPDINNHLNSTKKINWLKGLDVAMKNQVIDQYSYQERSEQIKLRSYFEKQHQDIELRKKLGIDNTKMIETIQSF